MDKVEQKTIAVMKGYKMTDDNMCCRGFQYELGKVHELGNDNSLELCGNGFHFCKYPSGVWSYYSKGRMFEVECYDVLETPQEAGADYKLVCRKIKFIKEVGFDGDYNTGYRNTGNYNTGDYNTGYRNTGDYNTGNYNTGNYNTGYRNTGNYNTGNYNTGNYNTGDYNTGDYNTGYRNTGNYNTGYYNTGYRNTGNYNTGYRNTGDYNIANGSSGMFNTSEKFFMFGMVCKVEWDDIDHALAYEFHQACLSDEPFDVSPYLSLPNATEKRLRNYHKKAIESRRK